MHIVETMCQTTKEGRSAREAEDAFREEMSRPV